MLIHVTVDETVVMEKIVPPRIVFGPPRANISSEPSLSSSRMAAIDDGEVMRVRAEGISPGGLPCFPSLIGSGGDVGARRRVSWLLQSEVEHGCVVASNTTGTSTSTSR